MDGNGRWAQAHNLPRTKGHEEGANSVAACVEECGELKIPYLTLYAFGVDNWKRPESEISALMGLLEYYLNEKLDDLLKYNVRVRAIGRLHQLPDRCRRALDRAISATGKKAGEGLTVTFALSYGGREEIVDAVRDMARKVREGELDPEKIDAGVLRDHLYDPTLPDPDLLIRTSGEMRLSNFLLWQLSYTELHISPILWPDFRREQFREAVQEFSRRHRRYGAI